MAQQPKTGFRFEFGGVNLTSVPDSLEPPKFSSALNVRGYSPNSIRTRPGYSKLFGTSNNNSGAPITDVQSLTAIQTDNNPAFLLRDANGNVWLGQPGNNTAAHVGNMNGAQGYGASMLPWRPSQSPQTWVYVATEGDYQKFSAPGNNNTVTQFKVGIEEPQVALDGQVLAGAFTSFLGNNSNWVASGTATLTGNGNLITDTVAGVPIGDPVVPSRVSVPVSIPYYLTNSIINWTDGNGTGGAIVQDVIPPIATCTVQAIYYDSGNNGSCQVVTPSLPIGEGPTSPTILGSLRRGAIVTIGNNSSSESVLVLSATAGPNGSAMFECSTSATRSANDTITGVQCFVMQTGAIPISAGDSIFMPSVNSTITGAPGGTVNTSGTAVAWASGSLFLASWIGLPIVINGVAYTIASVPSPTSIVLTTSAGSQTGATYISGGPNTGTLTQNLSVNPFAVDIGGRPYFPTEDDYVRLAVLVSNVAELLQIQVVFICDTYGTFTYTTTALENLVAGDLSVIEFPISALVPSGTNISLASCTAVQISVTTAALQTFDIASLAVMGGSLPDIGETGAPYQYRYTGRSLTTGATSNPSPAMRYGVSPRRESVALLLPFVSDAIPGGDPQVDVWDIYRYGGSLTSYQYVGTGIPGGDFIDNYFDDTVQAGAPLPTQNYEPWPSVDVPWSATSGGGASITVTGTHVVVSGPTVWPGTILRWLPGTLVLFDEQTGYTLRTRPTQINSTSYLFDLQESVGSLSPGLISINEPFVARQTLPYLWGPDQNGYVFACGDPLRPGVVSFCTPNNPDVTASTDTNEPSTPSEPLMGGEILGGVSYLSSSDRWWAMFPAFSGSVVFAPYQVNVGRGMAAPYGICTDRNRIFFVAKDGVGFHQGGPYKSLTDDLYLLFPHEDVQGVKIVRNGVPYYPPDYSRAGEFRLTWINDFLYFDYVGVVS